jgi:hypothetical protein
MIPKSGYRFSEKIMLKQQTKSEIPIQPFRFLLAGVTIAVLSAPLGGNARVFVGDTRFFANCRFYWCRLRISG